MSVQRGGPRRDDPAGSGPPASSATAKGPETAPSREPLRGAPRDRSTTPEAGGTREDVGELVRRIRELADKGETREAVRTAAAAAERHPSRAEPQHLLSLALLEEGRPEDALKAVRACIYLDAEHGPAYLTLGAVHLKLGHRHAATRAFAEATRRGHDAPAAV